MVESKYRASDTWALSRNGVGPAVKLACWCRRRGRDFEAPTICTCKGKVKGLRQVVPKVVWILTNGLARYITKYCLLHQLPITIRRTVGPVRRSDEN